MVHKAIVVLGSRESYPYRLVPSTVEIMPLVIQIHSTQYGIFTNRGYDYTGIRCVFYGCRNVEPILALSPHLFLCLS